MQITISLAALDCRGDLVRLYLSNRWKNADRATDTQLLLTRAPAAEKYGPVARTFPILIRHSRPAIPRKKKRQLSSCNKLSFGGEEQIKGRRTPHRDCERGQEGARIEKRKEEDRGRIGK